MIDATRMDEIWHQLQFDLGEDDHCANLDRELFCAVRELEHRLSVYDESCATDGIEGREAIISDLKRQLDERPVVIPEPPDDEVGAWDMQCLTFLAGVAWAREHARAIKPDEEVVHRAELRLLRSVETSLRNTLRLNGLDAREHFTLRRLDSMRAKRG